MLVFRVFVFSSFLRKCLQIRVMRLHFQNSICSDI